MTKPEIWGPPTWTFFHVLIDHVNETHFESIKQHLFMVIKRICTFLPCPECSSHASHFLNKINITAMKSKQQMINTFYIFHNMVNKRKNKNLYPFLSLQVYKQIPLFIAFHQFLKVYNTKGNMNLLMESFQRQLIIKDVKKWLYSNIHHFHNPQKIFHSPPPQIIEEIKNEIEENENKINNEIEEQDNINEYEERESINENEEKDNINENEVVQEKEIMNENNISDNFSFNDIYHHNENFSYEK
jgi:hypothetical protein